MRRCSLSAGAVPGTDAAILQMHLRFADVMIVGSRTARPTSYDSASMTRQVRCSRSISQQRPAGHLRGRIEAGKSGGGIRCGFARRACTALPACRWGSQRQVFSTGTRMIGPDRLPGTCT